MRFRRWLLAPILHQLHHIILQSDLIITQGNATMSALEDLKAADARIHEVVNAAKAAITNLGEQNTALKSDKAALEAQVADLTAKLTAATDETAVAAIAADLNKAADDLRSAVPAP